MFYLQREKVVLIIWFLFNIINTYSALGYTGNPLYNLDDVISELPIHRIPLRETLISTRVSYFTHLKAKFDSSIKGGVRLSKLARNLEFMEENLSDYIHLQREKKEKWKHVIYGSLDENLTLPDLELNSENYTTAVRKNDNAVNTYKKLGEANDAVFSLMREAAEQGNLTAIYNLGVLHTKYGDPLAVEYFKIAAKAGYIRAGLALAEIFRGGLLGQTKNPFLARKICQLVIQSTEEDTLAAEAARTSTKIRKKYKGYEESRLEDIELVSTRGIDQGTMVRSKVANIREQIQRERYVALLKAFLTMGASAAAKMLAN